MSRNSPSRKGGPWAKRAPRTQYRAWLKLFKVRGRQPADDASTELIQAAQTQLKRRRGEVASATTPSDPLEQLYQVCSGWILHILLTKGIPDAEIPDCFEVAWTAVLKGLATFHPESGRDHFRAWLTIITLNAVRRFRAHQRRKSVDQLSSEDEQLLASREEGAADHVNHVILAEQAQVVLALVRSHVSEPSFEAFYQHDFERKSYGEIGKSMKVDPKAARRASARVRRKYRVLFKATFGNPF